VLTAVAMVGAEIGELRAHLSDVMGDMTGVRSDITGLRESVNGLTRLSHQVNELAIAVDELAGADDDKKAPKPVDLAHLDDDDRALVLEALANWVRTVLFTGWPWTQNRIRACWPHHPDLINDLLLLMTCYEAAYTVSGRRSHHAVEYRHLLDYVADVADERTRDCDPARHEVTLPARNDLGAMTTAARDMVLAKVWRLTEHANQARRLGRDELAAQAENTAAELFDEHKITPTEYQSYEQRIGHSRAAAQHRQTRAAKDD
jgi:hypothetical protein